jgi:hypothetical protein
MKLVRAGLAVNDEAPASVWLRRVRRRNHEVRMPAILPLKVALPFVLGSARVSRTGFGVPPKQSFGKGREGITANTNDEKLAPEGSKRPLSARCLSAPLP